MTELLSIAGVQKADKTKTVEELAKQGCHFVVQGEAFEALMGVLELAIEGAGDAASKSWLASLKAILTSTTVPVKPKSNQVVTS